MTTTKTTTTHPAVDIETFERRAGSAPDPTTTAPRWARRAAVLAVLVTLPSEIWRILMAVGVPVGVSEGVLAARFGFPGWGTMYVFGLSLAEVGLASLTLGLVRPWGEVAPRWMPVIGGKRVRPLAAVVPAAVGAFLLTLLWVVMLSNFGMIAEEFGLEGPAEAVVLACYTPLLAWGPLLGAVTVSYYRRRTAHRVSES